MPGPLPDERPHGFVRMMLDSCECEVCEAAAGRQLQRVRELLAAEGRPSFRDGEAVAEHLRELHIAGLTDVQIGTVTGLRQRQLQALAGAPRQVRADLAARVMSVQVGEVYDPELEVGFESMTYVWALIDGLFHDGGLKESAIARKFFDINDLSSLGNTRRMNTKKVRNLERGYRRYVGDPEKAMALQKERRAAKRKAEVKAK